MDGYGISDGCEVSVTLRFGRKAVPGLFHVTSGGELYLPVKIADQVEIYARKYPDASVYFEMEGDPNAVDDIEKIKLELKDLPETTRRAIIEARIGQGEFRTKLMRKYGRKCAVTGVAIPSLLRASHIKTWRESNNEERLSADNGFLLIANLDAAFDAKLISFSDKGEILFHQSLGPDPHSGLGIRKGSKLSPLPSSGQRKYLAHHRGAADLLHS